jgi:Cys-rich repeat protein
MSRILCIFLTIAALFAVGCSPEAQATFPDRRGGRGEPCLVTNDCKEPLLCLGGRCLDEHLAFEPTGKVCAAAQCLTSADCCPPLSRPDLEVCKELQADCQSYPSSCATYERICKCKASCKANLCVASTPGSECKANADCFGGEACRKGVCVECTKDAECGSGHVCEATRCVLGCTHHEQCGALEKCDKLRCVDRGCKHDRECVLVLGERDAKCGEDGECGLPCKNDAACAYFGGYAGVAGCQGGFCKMLGCAENSDCQSDAQPFGEATVSLCVSRDEAERLRDASTGGR